MPSRIRRVGVLFKDQAYFIWGLRWCQLGGKAQKRSFVSTFTSQRGKGIYIRSAYFLKVQPSLVTKVPA